MNAPIAITPGDPAGIGPEIVAKAFRDAPQVLAGCFVIGDVALMRRAAALVGGALPVAQLTGVADALHAPPRCIPVWPLPAGAEWDVLQNSELLTSMRQGHVSDLAGKFSAACVHWAARAALRGEVAAMVTAPIHKEAWGLAGVPFPGHTELLQAEAAAYLGKTVGEVPVRMMLANDELRTVLVSIHLSLKQALEGVTYDAVLQTLRITHASLLKTLGRAPRIAVAGLNPHAGEGGLFGREEIEVINPAIAAARAEGIDAQGALPPDTVFMQARGFATFDVVVAMYHDQGLIPVKYLGVDKGVNVTLGLPLVRTSPDHGTAFDIAGQGVADASSLIEAVRQAKRLAGIAL
ncbi:MAG: 4-hydroxythreonine-4-phosphate dehydrogenase PdxA [Burkholderiaceae bacterium]